MHTIERRQATRYTLRLPIETTRINGEPTAVKSVTENISSRAILFTSPAPIPVGTTVEFTVAMVDLGTGVALRCAGKVVRMELRELGASAVVATIERHEYLRS